MPITIKTELGMCVFCCSVKDYDQYTYCDKCQDHGYTPIEQAMDYLDFTEDEKRDWRNL
jgi:hypothetical protein